MGIFMKRKLKRMIGYLFLMIGLLIVGTYFLKAYLPNFKQISIYEIIPGLEENEVGFVLQDKPLSLEHSPIVEEEVLLPFSLVKEYIDPYIFWDPGVGKITITTENKVIQMATEDLTYYINYEPLTLELPLKLIGEVPYIPVSFLKQFFPIEVAYHEATQIVTLDHTTQARQKGKIIKENIKLRKEGTIKSPIITTLKQGTEVIIYEKADEWYRIRTQDGVVGYISNKAIGEIIEVLPDPIEEVEKEPIQLREGKINLVWHQLFAKSDLKSARESITGIDGLDVISPTWFSLANEEGDLDNIADLAYVKWAKSQGYQVWALVDNKFDSKLTHAVLSNTDKREKVIKQLLAFISLYELDGINIDFESVAQEDGIYFLQFMRELAPFMKEQGAILSVDFYVPAPWTAHYYRKEVSEVVDYAMVMTYDEHWSTSPKSGSVASLGFVEKGIVDTLKEIPKEKVLMGLPYYTRIWEEQEVEGVLTVKSKAYSMQRAYDIFVENGAEIKWDSETGQYYGEYEKDGIKYRCWFEEEESIEQKVQFVHKYDLAGVAGWKKGLEKPEIWQLLQQKLK